MIFLDSTSIRAHQKRGGFGASSGPSAGIGYAPGLLDSLPDVPGWVVGDRGLASDAFRERIRDLGAWPAIPTKKTDAPVACLDWIGANRRLVENLWARLKERRAVATRHEKTAQPFLGVPQPRCCLRLDLELTGRRFCGDGTPLRPVLVLPNDGRGGPAHIARPHLGRGAALVTKRPALAVHHCNIPVRDVTEPLSDVAKSFLDIAQAFADMALAYVAKSLSNVAKSFPDVA